MDKAGGSVEPYTLNSSAGNSAPVGGRRHPKKHLKKVSAKTIKRTLRRLGLKPKGRVVIKGGKVDPETGVDDGTGEGGRRRRHTKRHRKTRGLFGMRGLRY